MMSDKWRRRFLPKDGAAGKTVHGFDSITNPDVEVWIEIAAYEDMKSQISCMESEDALNAYELKIKALEQKLAASERVKLYAIEQFTKACIQGDSVGLSEFDMTIKELEVIK
jgi:hypothetical protein